MVSSLFKGLLALFLDMVFQRTRLCPASALDVPESLSASVVDPSLAVVLGLLCGEVVLGLQCLVGCFLNRAIEVVSAMYLVNVIVATAAQGHEIAHAFIAEPFVGLVVDIQKLEGAVAALTLVAILASAVEVLDALLPPSI
jgi:hypothetical protein